MVNVNNIFNSLMNLFIVLSSSALADQFIYLFAAVVTKNHAHFAMKLYDEFGFDLKPRLLYTTCFINNIL